MKLSSLFYIFAAAILCPLKGQAVVFQTSSVSSQDYLIYLNQNGKKSVTEYLQEKLNRSSPSSEDIVQNSELKDPNSILKKLNSADRPPTTHYTLGFLKEFGHRSLQMKKSKEAEHIFCFAQTLLGEESNSCKTINVATADLQLRFPNYQILMIEGAPFSFQKIEHIKIQPKQSYHFTLLSNSRKPITHIGTWQSLLQYSTESTLWVQGDCDSFHTAIDDMSLRLQAEIMFKNCIRTVQQSDESKLQQSWVQRNKKWIYLSGALLLGAGLYTMKDKTIVIDRSVF